MARPREKVEVKLNCSLQLHGGHFKVVRNQPSSLIGIPYDRPVVGYGGKTINVLRLWSAAAPDYFDFKEFGAGDFIGALGETLEAELLTRVLQPDYDDCGARTALPSGVFPSRVLIGRSRATLSATQ